MKRLLLIVLPLLLIVGCSKPVEDSTLINKDGLMYLPESETPYSGEVFTNYSSGEKLYQGTYENGLLVTYSYLNKDGTVKEPVNYETTFVERYSVYYTKDTNQPYNGQVFSLYEDGKKKVEGTFKDGKENGLWTEWKNNGDKESEILYKDGESINEWTSNYYYYENGQKEYVVTLKDGELDGLETSWYRNGQKRSETSYKDGEQDGLVTYWYENGQKMSEETFKDGKELDSFNTWNEDGRTMVKNGNGVNIWWYENGQKKSEGTYKNGKREGKWTTWSPNGKESSELIYKDGEPWDGLDTFRYENGQKWSEVTYKDGKKDGLYTWWYENGQKSQEGTIKDGKEISSKSWNEDGTEQ